MVLGQLRAVHKMRAPSGFDVAASADDIVRVGMGVAAEPDIYRTGIVSEIGLELLRLRLVIDEIKIGSPFGNAIDTVITAMPEATVRIARHALEIS